MSNMESKTQAEVSELASYIASKRVVRASLAGQFRVTSPDCVPDLDEVVVGEEERMLDNQAQQLPKIHPMDLTDDVFLIAHAESLRGVAQIEKWRGRPVAVASKG